MQIYVSADAGRNGDGSKQRPFRHIQDAAACALPGDEVIVAPGIYREYVDPVCAGTPEKRITYRSEVPKMAVITGAEPVKCWENTEGTVWRASIPNALFGTYNPYQTEIFGDWYFAAEPLHTGEVYLNGKSMYETMTLEGVLHPQVYQSSWDPDFTVYKWYTQQDPERDCTVIYANFHGIDPNEENVEINVRENCFYPSKEGIGYITLSGFTVRQAATQWAPPTAYQEGMIGPHWSKGWIIEDCEVSESKCSGISLGKYLQPNNDNKWYRHYVKDGTQTERDAICQAQNEGWSKKTIGSHIIRRCNIHDCGQTGIVGHLGGVFSLIEDNHIHHINNKQDLAGAEIGGIKMHAAIDVTIRRNRFDHCTRGLWLDWQAQGTRVSANLFHDNTPPDGCVIANRLSSGEDIFVEVSHGPTLIDHNLLLSDAACRLCTQGLAFVHNLIAGSFTMVGQGVENRGERFATPRYTPYHVPHGTQVAGFMTILHGDARFYNNIFVQKPVRPLLKEYAAATGQDRLDFLNDICGTKPYDGYPTGEAYFGSFVKPYEGQCRDPYYDHLPVYTGGNMYFNGAQSCSSETDAVTDTEHTVHLALKEKDGQVFLDTDLYTFADRRCGRISTETLGEAFEPEQRFENPDGTDIFFDRDYFDEQHGFMALCGPFANADECSRPLFQEPEK